MRIWSWLLTLKSIAESAAKAIAAQQKSLDSLVKAVLGNRIALVSLLAKQGGVCAVVNTACCTCINTPGEIETQLHKITEQATWLERVTPFNRVFLWLVWSWGPWLWSALCRGTKFATPKCLFSMWIYFKLILSWKQGPKDSRRSFDLHPNCLKMQTEDLFQEGSYPHRYL